MKVLVEMYLADKPSDRDAKDMLEAAKEFTNDVDSVKIAIHKKRSNTITALFKMDNTAQYKVVDTIAETFKTYVPDYEDITISFPK